jgi:uncharacterized membrane protein YjfL (UPF0719 family)
MDYLIAGGKLGIAVIGGLFLVTWVMYNVITSFRDYEELYTSDNKLGKPNVAYLIQRLALPTAFTVGVATLLAERVTDAGPANPTTGVSTVVYNIGEEYLWIVIGGVALLAVLYLARRVFQKVLPFADDAKHGTLSVGIARSGLLVAVGVIFGRGFQMAADTSAIAAGAQALFIAQALVTLAIIYRLGTAHFGLNQLIREGNQSAAYLSSGIVLGLAFVIGGAISAEFTNLARYETFYWITVGVSLVLFAVLAWVISWGLGRWEAATLRDRARELATIKAPQNQYATAGATAASPEEDTQVLNVASTAPQGSFIAEILRKDKRELAASLGLFIMLVGYLAGVVAI